MSIKPDSIDQIIKMKINTFILLGLVLSVYSQDGSIVPEPEVQTRTVDYEVSLEHLCPVAPSEEAAQCLGSYNLSQNVEQVLSTSTASYPDEEKYGKILQLTQCSIQKVPHLNFSLEFYCYFKGVREFLLKEFRDIKTLERFNELMVKLGDLILEEPRKEFKDFYQKLFDELQIKHSQIVALEEMSNDKSLIITEELGYKINPDIYAAGTPNAP